MSQAGYNITSERNLSQLIHIFSILHRIKPNSSAIYKNTASRVLELIYLAAVKIAEVSK
jgi:hypothetical protein